MEKSGVGSSFLSTATNPSSLSLFDRLLRWAGTGNALVPDVVGVALSTESETLKAIF
jgi:hypothetical protein